MTNTKVRHLEIYTAAVEVLENVGGVKVIDGLAQDDRLHQLRKMAKTVEGLTDCHISSAKRNIAKAMRRARYGTMKDKWGGSRPGAGLRDERS